MSDIVLDIEEICLTIDKNKEHTPPSSIDDCNRKELLWEKREEKILNKWKTDCELRSDLHESRGKHNKIKYRIIGIPSIIIPLVLGGVSSVVPCHSLSYSLGMMASGLLTSIGIFLNFGKKQQQHMEFMNRFFELSIEIESELCKPKCHRIACDVYIEKIKQQYNNYCSLSPEL